MNQQDLVWVRLKFSNLEESKVRPALIISNDKYNKRTKDVVVCAITSKMREIPYSILVNNRDLSLGELPIKSRVRADKILHVEQSLVIRPFARLKNRTFDTVVEKVGHLIKRD